MRLTMISVALCAALGSLSTAHASDSAETAAFAAKAAYAASLGFDQVGFDPNGRQSVVLMHYGQESGAKRASARSGAVLRAADGDAVTSLFHAELGTLVGMLPGSAMRVREAQVSAEGSTFYNLEQSYQGVPVVGREVTVQVGNDGAVQGVFGSAATIEALDTVATVAGEKALYSAARAAAGADGLLSSNAARAVITLEDKPRLVVFQGERAAPVLAWEAVAKTGDESFRSRVYADAKTGRLIEAQSLIFSVLNRRIYDANGACVPGGSATLVLSEGGSTTGVNPQAVRAYNGFGNVYHYFRSAWNIDSYDNRGGTLTGYVNALVNVGGGCTADNAAWGNGTMYLGRGGSSLNDTSLEPDVTYHEFGHGVTGATSNLVYARQSGGLNEAASDIYAAMVEAWVNTIPGGAAGPSTPIAYQANGDSWTVGEGLVRNSTRPLRDMRDPASDGRSLDRYSQYVSQFGSCSPSAGNDNCGVHSTSGIANLAFYLLATGGRHPRNATTIQVGAIPFDRAAKYWLESNQLKLVGTNATFTDMRNAMQTRARANGAVGLCDEVRVSQAWAAVEVTGVAPQNANACGGGGTNQSPVASFSTTSSGLTVNVNGSGSSDPDGSIASYAWNFGDNSTATGSTASHAYAAAGTYTVTLTVTDNQGATNTTTRSVTVTSGGNPQCPGDAYSGSFSGATGQSQYQPTGGSYTTAASGAHTICLSGPAGTDYDVYLQKRSASGTWSNVAQGTGSTSTERVTYSGTAGTYRVRVTNFSGTGAYTGSLQKP